MDGMNISSEEIFFKRKEEEREVGVKERSRGRVGKSRSQRSTGKEAKSCLRSVKGSQGKPKAKREGVNNVEYLSGVCTNID